MGAHAQRLHNGVLEQRALICSILGVQVVSQRQTECPGQHHEGISPSFGGMFQQHWVCESWRAQMPTAGPERFSVHRHRMIAVASPATIDGAQCKLSPQPREPLERKSRCKVCRG